VASTVRGAFSEFSARLEPTSNQISDAVTKHTGVRDCIDGSMWVKQALLVGSYARRTIIKPVDDIDLLVVLDEAKHSEFLTAWDGVSQLLDRFHSRLKYCYPDTPIRKDHPAVHLDFASIGFDVVPGFPRIYGAGYRIPSPKGYGWIDTDPTKHAEFTTAMNSATGGMLVPLVKMFKSWNRTHYERLTGFHLEVALGRAWPTQSTSFLSAPSPVRYDTYAQAAAALFAALAARLRSYREEDPAGLSGYVDEYLDSEDRRLTVGRLESAAEAAQIALRHEERGWHADAIEKWRGILLDPFPAYS
jgi:hypothetical protein